GGAGFTGVEFLGERVASVPVLREKYGIVYSKVKIKCLEADPSMLPMFPDELTEYAVKYLEDRGAKFMIGKPVVAANENGFVVNIDDKEQQLEASSVIWSAGVRGSSLMEESFDGVKRGRIIVKPDLTIEGYEDIYAIGDVSAVMNGEGDDARPY